MQGVEPIEALWPIRLRPAMYIGAATPAHLVEAVATNIAIGTPAPRSVRVHLFAESAVAIAIDGEPLSIELVGDVPHPALYSHFLQVTHHVRHLGHAGCIANALSVRLVVSTMHDGTRYRAAFSRGGLVTLLSRAPVREALGASWLTFEPDATLLSGGLTFEDVQSIVARLSSSVAITAHDRTDRETDWY